MELQTFIFIGRSGCGKGTQVTLLQEYIRKQDQMRYVFYIETGERFRQFIKEHSLSSRLAAGIYKTGDRQPDFIAVWMWSHLLVERMTGEEHVIFDGTPRSLQEAQIVDTAITFYNRQRPHVRETPWRVQRIPGRSSQARRAAFVKATEFDGALVDDAAKALT